MSLFIKEYVSYAYKCIISDRSCLDPLYEIWKARQFTTDLVTKYFKSMIQLCEKLTETIFRMGLHPAIMKLARIITELE